MTFTDTRGRVRQVSQGELAKRAGLALQTVHRIERDQNEPDAPTMEALAFALIELGAVGINPDKPLDAFYASNGRMDGKSAAAKTLSAHLKATALAAQRGDSDAAAELERLAEQLVAAEGMRPAPRVAKKRVAPRKR